MVRTEQVAAADFERGTRSELELLGRDIGLVGRTHDARSHFETAAPANGRQRCFLDSHEHVTPRLVAARDLRDSCTTEEAGRRQAPLALTQRVEPERLARFHPQLALDDVRSRARVADDQHVVDEHARPLPHREHDVRTALIGAQARTRVDGHALVSEVGVLQFDGIAIGREPRNRERLPRRQGETGDQVALVDGLIALDAHGVHYRLRVLRHLDPDRDRHVLIGRRRRRRRRGLGTDARETDSPVHLLDLRQVGVKGIRRKRLTGANTQPRRHLGRRQRAVADDVER
ncbi:MAG: hypothetical protein QM736_14440 [Vicinamibacterales bacterium]